MRDKIKSLLEIYRGKLDQANEYNQHCDALKWEGAILVLETLFIYANQAVTEQTNTADPKSWGGFCEVCGIQSAHDENCPERQGPLI